MHPNTLDATASKPVTHADLAEWLIRSTIDEACCECEAARGLLGPSDREAGPLELALSSLQAGDIGSALHWLDVGVKAADMPAPPSMARTKDQRAERDRRNSRYRAEFQMATMAARALLREHSGAA